MPRLPLARVAIALSAIATTVVAVGVYRYTAQLRDRAALYQSRWESLRRDPAGLARYRADNARLRAAGRVPGRVVFLGASITEEMDLPSRFPDAAFVNRGIGGQLAWQQLLRMDEDVFSLQPEAVVIKICATNFESGAPPMDQTRAVYALMVDAARAHGVRPILATVIPVSREYAARSGVPLAARIDEINRWIRARARTSNDALVDYAAALADAEGYLPPSLTDDGLHPNARGYARMTSVLRASLPTSEQTAARAEVKQ